MERQGLVSTGVWGLFCFSLLSQPPINIQFLVSGFADPSHGGGGEGGFHLGCLTSLSVQY